jgi:hypothetical protein
MGPAYFVIALLGCADGGGACTEVATLPAHYGTETECTAATAAALVENSNLDFPTIVARCRAGTTKAAAAQDGNERSGKRRRS